MCAFTSVIKVYVLLRRDQHKLRVAAAADAAELNHSSHMVHSKQEAFFFSLSLFFFIFPAAAVRLDFPGASHAFTLTLLFFSVPPCGALARQRPARLCQEEA